MSGPIDRFLLRIAEIRDNRTDGALELARQAARAVAALPPEEDLEGVARAMEASQPCMAPIRNLAARIRLSHDPAGTAREFLDEMDRGHRATVSRALELIPTAAVVLTHSASRTVFDAIVAARPSAVIATESLPGGEGRAQAEALAAAGIACRVIPDAAAYEAASASTLVLTGADWISPRFVTNKIGTALVVLAARERAIPRYCLGSSLKRVDFEPPPDDRGLFEPTPVEWFTEVIAPDGLDR